MPEPISVVVPAFNAGPFLRRCVESILAQTQPVQEILVVDDGSSDETADIAAGFGDPIRLLSQRNSGVSTARNRGLREARAPLVAFCDADDLWMPEKIGHQLEALAEHSSASAVFSGVVEVDGDLRPIGVIPCPPLHAVTYADLLWHRRGRIPPQIPSTLLARRELLQDLGGWDPELSDAADWDMALRLRRRGSFAGSCVPAVRYRVHPGGMSFKTRERASDAKRLFRKLLAAAGPDEVREVRAAWGRTAVVMASSLARSHGIGEALGWFLPELLRDPGALGRAVLSRVLGE